MDDSTFDEILASFNPPAAESTATEAAAPEGDDLPNDDSLDAIDAQPSPEPDAEAESAAPPEAPAPPPAIDWNHPELAALKQQAETNRQQAEAFRLVRQAVLAKQQQEAAQRFQTDLTDLADGDPERSQKIATMLAQVQAPLQQRLQTVEKDAAYGTKLASAFHMAMRAELPEEVLRSVIDRTNELMQFEGPQVMERMALSRKEQSAREQALDRRVKELERQIAASQVVSTRQARGADAVDGGGGSAPLDFDTRLRQADTLDDFFKVMGL